MKRLGLMAVGLLVLVGCQQVNQPSEKKVDSPATEQVYQAIVSDYETALRAEDRKLPEGSLVNPISLDMTWRYGGFEEVTVVSQEVDLDQDGQKELLVGAKVPGDEQEWTIYTGAYGVLEGQVVDLLAPILVEESDNMLVFYTNNRLSVNQARSDATLVTAVYQLKGASFEELAYFEAPLADDDSRPRDRKGKLYSQEESETLLIKALGHGWEEEVLQ